MNVIVVGCGRVGSGLATLLSEQGDSVAVVDRDEAAFGRLPHDFDGRTVVGVGFDRVVLRRAGIEQADALAAVTSGDNSNIVVARVAKETFGLEHVVARIYDPHRARIYQRLGIPTVATSQWTIEQVLRRIRPDGRAVEWTDPTSTVCLVERPVASAVVGRTVQDLGLGAAGRIVAVLRFGEARVAAADLVLQEDDILYVAAPTAGLEDLDALLAPSAEEAR